MTNNEKSHLKTTIELLWRKKVLIVFLVALFILFPTASVRPAQMLSKTLLLSVGVDKINDEYQVSGVAVVNEFSSSGKFSTRLVSANGKSVSEAIDKLTANEGRKVSLAHCNLIIIGAGAGGNMSPTLDHFLHEFEMSNNALLIYTPNDVKKVQETSIANVTGSTAGLLETIAIYNQNKVFKKQMTLEQFYKDTYRKDASAQISVIELESDTLVNPKTKAFFKNGKFSHIE